MCPRIAPSTGPCDHPTAPIVIRLPTSIHPEHADTRSDPRQRSNLRARREQPSVVARCAAEAATQYARNATAELRSGERPELLKRRGELPKCAIAAADRRSKMNRFVEPIPHKSCTSSLTNYSRFGKQTTIYPWKSSGYNPCPGLAKHPPAKKKRVAAKAATQSGLPDATRT